MTLDDFIVKCDGLLKKLDIEMPNVSDEVALNALALIKNRIIDQRHGIEGAHYSTHPMLATRDMFVVKSAFKQSKKEVIQLKRKKDKKNFHTSQIGKAVSSKSGRSFKTKTVKKGVWIKFPGASKAVPVMILERGYREFREIQGRPGDHVNASLTGHMWQATTIVARTHKAATWITIIGGLDTEAQNKLLWLTEHFGAFLTVLPDEMQKLSALYHTRLQTIINNELQ